MLYGHNHRGCIQARAFDDAEIRQLRPREAMMRPLIQSDATDVPRKFIRKYLPSHDQVRKHRALRWLGPALHSPNLWHLNRRSVARGVAVGLFTGLFPPPFQMISAAVASVALRVNLPVAVVATLYTNPLTMAPIYFFGYQIGVMVTGERGNANFASLDFQELSLPGLWQAVRDFIASASEVFLLGVLLEGILFAVIGYFLVDLIWRAHVIYRWRKRIRARNTTA